MGRVELPMGGGVFLPLNFATRSYPNELELLAGSAGGRVGYDDWGC